MEGKGGMRCHYIERNDGYCDEIGKRMTWKEREK
jgi:hypothetical protein